MWIKKRKLLFIHIPKCGGTTIEDHLKKHTRKAHYVHAQHSHAQPIRRHLGGKEYDKYFKFTVVRNPWDKTLSQYFYKCRSVHNWKGQKEQVSFEEYVRVFEKDQAGYKGASFPVNYLSSGQSRLTRHQPRMLPYIINKKTGKLIVDYVARFENYKQDVNHALRKVGLPLLGGRWSNVSKWEKPASHRAPYWEYYNDETRDIIAREFKADIDRFGYEFGK